MKSYRLQLRFLLPLCLLVVLAAYLTVPFVDRLTLRWFESDLDIRARVIGEALAGSISGLDVQDGTARLQREFNRVIRDERLMAVALCDADDRLLVGTAGFPADLDCRSARAAAPDEPAVVAFPSGDAHLAVIPARSELLPGAHLLLLHDVSYIRLRSADTRNYLIALFAVLGCAIALITVFVAHVSWRGWVAGTKALLRGEGLLKPFRPPPEFVPVVSDLRAVLREMEDERRYRMHLETWTPERLRSLLGRELRGDHVMLVSNREPYIHVHDKDGIKVQSPASGLVTAVEPVMRACSGTWIAHGSGSADREVVDAGDRISVPPEHPAYVLRRVWLSEEEEQGYYYGFANEGLWPLCHVAHVRPVFRLSDWNTYREVNQRFADVVASEARTDDPIVLVQDYHFALLPRMIRERLPRATIITFWHIPWPNPESFGICPWHQELLEGLLGSTILGFHTRYHCKNFIETVDRFLEARIRHEDSTISFNHELTQVNAYPISIHWPGASERAQWASVEACRQALRDKLGVPGNTIVLIGIDRFDYTKGIIERFHAFERLLEKHPELRGKAVLAQFAAPTRSALDEYQSFVLRVHQISDRINTRFGKDGWQPIRLIAEHQEHATVTSHYRGADACVVTSLHDGMNLVAKEFVASRDDERGVLILSQFAGAARELQEALIVNPYHVEETADAMYHAITMPVAEQAERMRSMRALVGEDNVYRWAATMLLDTTRLRRAERIAARLSNGREGEMS